MKILPPGTTVDELGDLIKGGFAEERQYVELNEDERSYDPDEHLAARHGKGSQKPHGNWANKGHVSSGGGTAVKDRPAKKRRPKASLANKPKDAKSFVADGKEVKIVDAKDPDLFHFAKDHRPEYSPEEAEVLKRYTSEDHMQLNGLLRYGNWSKFDSRRKLEEEDVANLRSVIKKNTIKQDVILKRKASFEALGVDPLTHHADPASKVGTIIQDKGFMSTTAGGFSGSGYHYEREPVTLNIRVPAGTNGVYLNKGDLTKFPGEHEVLLGDGTKMVVLGAKQKGTTWEIDVQVLP